MSDGSPFVPNSRIKDGILPGMVTETIITGMNFTYDPLTQEVALSFTAKDVLYVNGEPQAMTSTAYENLNSSTNNLLTRSFGAGLYDPITGLDLGELTGAGFQIYLKNITDILYNERAEGNGYPFADTPEPSDLAKAQAAALFTLFGTPHGLSASSGSTSASGTSASGDTGSGETPSN